jgi:2-dehydro-3-deoxygalactonokinase
VILPGTHSKHIHLEGRNLEGFVTTMTGELFTHLRELPTLRGALAAGGEISEAEFREGVFAAQKFGLLAGLFKIRTRSLIAPHPGLEASSFLSGLLIGEELISLKSTVGATVFLAGSPALHPLYLLAGEQIGQPLEPIPPEVLQQSLLHAHRSLLPS